MRIYPKRIIRIIRNRMPNSNAIIFCNGTASKMAMAIDDDGPISFEIDSASANNKNLIGCQHQLRQELWPQSDFHRVTSNSCKSAIIQPPLPAFG